MRLLVVGGGVAGPAVALAATRLGLQATVLERRTVADPDEGSWITVAPNGLDALDVLGVLDEARAVGHPSRVNRMFGATGRHLGDVSLGTPLADGSVALTMKRSALAVLLADAAVRHGADVRLGADVTVRRGRRPGRAGRARRRHGRRGRRARRGRRRALAGASRDRPGGAGRAVRRADELRRHHAGHRARGRSRARGLALRVRATLVLRRAPAADRGRRVVRQRPPGRDRPRRARCHDRGAVARVAGRPRRRRTRARHPTSWPRVGSSSPATARSTCRTSRPGGVVAPSSSGMPPTRRRRAAARARPWPWRMPSSWPGRWCRHGGGGLAAYEAARRERVEAIVRAGARSSSAKIPGRVGRVALETMLSGLFRSGVAARSTALDHGPPARAGSR